MEKDMEKDMKHAKMHKMGANLALPFIILGAAWVTATRGLVYEGAYFLIMVYFLSLMYTSWTSKMHMK
jgi:hypothetical protein